MVVQVITIHLYPLLWHSSYFYGLAGQPAPLVLKRNGRIESLPLPPHRIPLGALSINGKRILETSLDPGELLLGYSDGVTEAQNPAGDFFGEDRLRTALEGCTDLPAEDVLERIISEIRQFVEGAPPYDDMTLVAARRIG